MPFFKVRLWGTGISYPLMSGGDPVIGFYTTRLVSAPDQLQAHRAAMEEVLSEWRPGGEYAEANAGMLPVLVVDESWRIGLLAGVFARRPVGYALYARDD